LADYTELVHRALYLSESCKGVEKMASIASILSSVAALVASLGVLYLVVKVSKAIDTLIEHIKTKD
jgi:hypothetical protein